MKAYASLFFSPDRPWAIHLAWMLGAVLLFFPWLGGVHLFDWDEINFAECAREMLATGNFRQVSINFRPFWEKPPLFIWMQAAAMSLFGVGEFAARLPNAVCGAITLPLLYELGRRLHSRQLGFFFFFSYAGSFLPHFYFRSGIIDPWFNLWIFLSVWALFRYVRSRRKGESLWIQSQHLAWAALFNGLGCLTKGPVAWLIVCLCVAVLWTIYRFKWFIKPLHYALFSVGAWLVLGFWFLFDYFDRGPWLMQEFVAYQYRLFSTPDAGHEGFPGFHFVFVFLGCFPASIFAIRALRPFSDAPEIVEEWRRWMIVLLAVVLALFSVVQSKIIHYSSLAYFPVTFLAAWAVVHLKGDLRRWQQVLLRGLTLLLVIVVLAFPWLARFRAEWMDAIADPFALGNLSVDVSWTGWEGAPIVLLGVGVLWGLVRHNAQAWTNSIATMFFGTCFALALLFYTLLPKIEPHTQGSAIAFFKGLQGENAYVHTLGYKSYAHYFYARLVPPENPAYYQEDLQGWLLEGDIDKDAYFAARLPKADKYRTDEWRAKGLQEIGAGGGFVFFKREKVSTFP